MTVESEPLFPVEDAYDGDPLRPDTATVTPVEVIAKLDAISRQRRVKWLIDQAVEIFEAGTAKHQGDREIAATCVLFSGGNDSTTLAHIFRNKVDYAVHANTGIGIEQTRKFVRDWCQMWGLPLIEKHPPPGCTYRELVIDKGFPGPAMHWKMYTRLKERCLEQVRNELVKNPRKERVVFVAGRRREESERRDDIPLHERKGSVIWTSPLAMWTKMDIATYRRVWDVPSNEVSDLIHMSGECLCGAFAKPGELDEIGYWFPQVVEDIRALESEVRAAGHPEPICRWGHGEGRKDSRVGMLCTSCQLFDVADGQIQQEKSFDGSQ